MLPTLTHIYLLAEFVQLFKFPLNANFFFRLFPNAKKRKKKMLRGKKLFIFEAGNTNGAHRHIVERLKDVGQAEVNALNECDYLLVFCPAVSRVGTDIGEALDNMPRGKPVILVVMHPTFNPDYVVAESRRQVTNPNVRLTVDCLFHDGKLLKSKRNNKMWNEIEIFLEVSTLQVLWFGTIKYLKNRRVLGIAALTAVAIYVYFNSPEIIKKIGL